MENEKHNIIEPKARTLKELWETMRTDPYEKFEAIEITKDDGSRVILGPAVAPNWYKGAMIGRRVTYEETNACNGIVTGQVSGYPDRATLESCPVDVLPQSHLVDTLYADNPVYEWEQIAMERWSEALKSGKYMSFRWNGLYWKKCEPGYLAATGGRELLED
jgi:hypothetical protein